LIGHFLQEFTSSQAQIYTDKIDASTGVIANKPFDAVEEGWATNKKTKLSSLPLPGFAEAKLNELVSL